MIAASDPQEFVPSGRQQTLRHPGPSDKLTTEIVNKIHLLDKFDSIILDKLEKVSLVDNKNDNECWMLRKPSEFSENSESCDKTPFESDKQNFQFRLPSTKSFFDYLDDNIKPSRISDSIMRKFKDNNLSTGSEDSRSISNMNVETTSQKNSDELLTKTKAGFIEEELYVKGHTVVWSRGIMNSVETCNNTKKIICSYTSTTPIKSILWCNFYLECPSYSLDKNVSGTFSSIKVPSVCVVDYQNIRVFTEKGEDFEVATPFQIGAIWSTTYGILIEKEPESKKMISICHDIQLDFIPKNIQRTFLFVDDHKDISLGSRALLYSLAYPLDDVCPVLTTQGSGLQFSNNSSCKIVFTSENPSICVIFDSQTKLHSVHIIRKIRNEEKDFYEKSIGYVSSVASSSAKLKNRLSIWENNQSNTRSPISKPHSLQNFHLHSKSQTSMATISRCQSPITSATSSPQMSLLASVVDPSQIHERSQSILDSSRSMILMKQFPLICLDYVWTEPNMSGDFHNSGPASKVFTCDDLAGQSYFCYVVSSKLFMVKADFSTCNISFGSINSISAKDATPLPHLHMLAILEHNCNVSLYSGMTIVGKLHLSGTLVKHTPTPCVRRFQSQMNTPFPRRSSMLPNCNQVDPQFDEHLFSPVLAPNNSSKGANVFQVTLNPEESVTLIGLRDPIENRMTLQYSDGTFFRTMLPLLATSPLVENCLNVLKQCLQREALMTFFTRWYSTRNSLGTQNFTNEQEWEMFVMLLCELLGYEEEHVSETFDEGPPTPSKVAKKRKQSPIGSDDDWQYLCNSKLDTNSVYVDTLLNITPTTKLETTNNSSKHIQINENAILFPYIKIIHFSFHLLYEDFKLNILKYNLLEPLAVFLNKLSNDLNMIDYSVHYWKDFPEKCIVKKNSELLPKGFAQDSNICNVAFQGVLNIMQHFSDLMNGKHLVHYPYLKYVNERSRDFVELFTVVTSALKDEHSGNKLTKTSGNSTDQASYTLNDVVLLMTQMKITTKVLDTLPFGLYLYLYNSIWKCREYPPANWPPESYLLVWREDLATQTMKMKKNRTEPSVDKLDIGNNQMHDINQPESEYLDGMEDIDTSFMKLRFPDDVRVAEARKMLQSSKPVPIVLVQRPDITDHDFIEEQEKHLYAVCTRTMALPVARGMFTLRTATPLITKPLPTPQLCLTGKSSPRGTTVELTHIDTPSNMSLWALFHNGVANGLRISPDASNIDSTWIVFNKPKVMDKQMEHGGFLLALGLHGHLKNLDVWNTFDYLAKHHEMLSVGILLGLACAFRGTGHTAVTKALSIHVEALLPPTSMELDLSQPLQVTALLGIGLLYQGTLHSHMTEVLLSEIGRPPGPEMENSSDRESYSLAAGLALGLVTLQRGGKSGLTDLNISDTLHYYMTGGTKRPFSGAQRDKYKVSSFQIREGASVNLDVTAPGATLALGLMYLGTHNKTIADWMSPPETQYLLDFIRPDFLMLRIISKSLILWNNIEPSKEWIEGQVPKNIRPFCMVQPSPLMDIDYEAMNQAYCNIISGACFAIGLRYAGSADEDACKILLHYCHMFISLTGKSISELAGKPTIETCLNVLLLSVAMVMAGTGNLEVMRLVRHLRKRVGISSSAVVTYGSHLAIHMALGLLFLGGGRYTLSNSPSSVAALICAFYPKFPTHSNDNRYHLQAFRHLYVLAAETRLIIPRDVYLGKSCYANLRIVKTNGSIFSVRAPAMLPDLDSLTEIAIDDERYWKIIFRKDQNWSTLKKILSANGYIDVKQRAGCLSYIVDKFGYHSQFARTLTQSLVSPWNPSSSSIKNFTSNQSVKYFCDNFLSYDGTELKECNLKKLFTKITYDAVVMDKLIVLPAFAAIRKMIEDIHYQPSSIQLWQFKLVLNQIQNVHSCDILSSEMILGIKEEILNCLESWETTLKPHLQKYLNGTMDISDSLILKRLAAYITFFDIPYSIEAAESPILIYMQHLSTKYSVYTISKLLNLIEI